MTTRFDDDPEFAPDDPLAVILRPPAEHLGPPAGRYAAIRRTAARRKLLRAAAGAGLTCAVAALVALPLHLASSTPASPTVPLAPPSSVTPKPSAPPVPTPSTVPTPAPASQDQGSGPATARGTRVPPSEQSRRTPEPPPRSASGAVSGRVPTPERSVPR
ncbi:hypothetical protein ACFC09_22470 [Streptomyces sp. NPDC056161]|uniref:hypothetical protein n=1 Tax=Streptomyces sp. NPDC056161 TaxID=3345732 RepID=UPI0035DFA190